MGVWIERRMSPEMTGTSLAMMGNVCVIVADIVLNMRGVRGYGKGVWGTRSS